MFHFNGSFFKEGFFRLFIFAWFLFFACPQAHALENDILKGRTIIVKGDKYYPPYEFINKNGQPDGFNVELFREVARELELSYTIELGSWSQVLGELENAEIDVLMGVMVSPQRAGRINFGIPHSVISHGVFTHDKKNYRTLDQLRGKEIIVQEKDFMHDYLLESGLTDQIITVRTQLEALQLLSTGRHDAALIGAFQGLHFIREFKISNVKIRASGIDPVKYAMAVSKGNEELLWLLNQGLFQLKATGKYDELYEKWFSVYEHHYFFTKHKMAFFIAGGFVLLLFAFLFILRYEVRRTTRKLQDSESNFRSFLDVAPVGIIISDENENVIFINRKFSELFGYTIREMPSVNEWWPLAYPDVNYRKIISERWEKTVKVAMENRSGIDPVEAEITCSNGSRRIAEIGFVSLGKTNVVTFVDVTKRKQAEEELLRSNAELDNYFNSSLDLLCIADTNGYFIRLNPEWEKVLGYRLSDLRNTNFLELIHPDDLDASYHALQKLKDQEEVTSFENRFRCKDGSYRWIEWRSKPHGEIIYAVARDITDRKSVQEALKENEQRLHESNLTKDKLFSIVAHDLRNPFNGIIGFSEILKNENENLDRNLIAKYSSIIFETAVQTYRLLDNLLNWARMQQGKINPKPQQISVAELFNDTLNLLDETARKKGIRLNAEIDDQLIIQSDVDMLKVVMRNLVNNAVKFTENDGSVTLTAELLNGEVCISVADTGIGISKENIGLLFDIGKNFTLRGTGDEKGTGIGLVLCREFIEKLGGNIDVQSEEGVGSKFFFTLPQNKCNKNESLK